MIGVAELALAEGGAGGGVAMDPGGREALDRILELLQALQGGDPARGEAPLSPADLLAAAEPVLARLDLFHGVALALLDAEEEGLHLAGVAPPARRGVMGRLLAELEEEGTAGWALQRSHPVVVPGDGAPAGVLLQAVATPSRTWGLLVGVLRREFPGEPERKTVSILATALATALHLHRTESLLAAHTRTLESEVLGRARRLESRAREVWARAQERHAFVARVAHEVRTPVHGLLGRIELLELRVSDPGILPELALIRRLGEHLLGVVNDTLHLARIEAGGERARREAVALRPFLEGCMEMVRSGAGGGDVEFRVKVDPTLPEHLVLDPLRVRQILLNLLDNGARASPGGTVILAARPLPATHPLGAAGVAFEVEDNGEGVDPADHARIFEPFARGRSTRAPQGPGGPGRDAGGEPGGRAEGSGLGLALSRSLAEAMGGSLELDPSFSGCGARFRLHLPGGGPDPEGGEGKGTGARGTAPGEAGGEAPPAPARQGPEAPSRTGVGVLVVEDDPVVRSTVLDQLRVLGVPAWGVGSPEGALAYLAPGADDPSGGVVPPFGLLLVDLRLGEESGLALARRIRAREEAAGWPRRVLLAFSADPWSEAHLVGTAPSTGDSPFDGGVTKPVRLEALAEALAPFLPLPRSSLPGAGEGAPPGSTIRARELLARDVPHLAALLHGALERREASRLLLLAHRIRGAGALVGHLPLVEAASQVEAGARAGFHPGLAGDVRRLLRALHDLAAGASDEPRGHT